MMAGVQAIAKGATPYIGSAAVQYGPGSEALHYLYLHIFGFDIVNFRQSTVLLYWLAATIFCRGPLHPAALQAGADHLPGRSADLPDASDDLLPAGRSGRRRGRSTSRLAGRLLGLAQRDALHRRVLACDAVPGGRGDVAAADEPWLPALGSAPCGDSPVTSLRRTCRRACSRWEPWRCCWLRARRCQCPGCYGALGHVALGFAAVAVAVFAYYAANGDLDRFLQLYYLIPPAVAAGYSDTVYLPRIRRPVGAPLLPAPVLLRSALRAVARPPASPAVARQWSQERVLLVSALVAACVIHGGALLRSRLRPPGQHDARRSRRARSGRRLPSEAARGLVRPAAGAGALGARRDPPGDAPAHPDQEHRQPGALAAGAVLVSEPGHLQGSAPLPKSVAATAARPRAA